MANIKEKGVYAKMTAAELTIVIHALDLRLRGVRGYHLEEETVLNRLIKRFSKYKKEIQE